MRAYVLDRRDRAVGELVRARVLIVAISLGMGAGCALTPPPHGYPTGALEIGLSSSYRDQINCPREDCERWFRTRLVKRGDLSVVVDASKRVLALRYSVRLMDAQGAKLIARKDNAGEVRVQIDRDLAPATYLIGVVSDPDGQAFDFRLQLAFEPAPPPPAAPPAPKFEIHSSAVLESVGYGRDAVAVLIESGAKKGMQVGFRGKLIDGGNQIGSVVIEQVFPDGSRARVVGTLSSPVTHATMALIEVPAGLGIGNTSEELPFEFPPTDEDGGQER